VTLREDNLTWLRARAGSGHWRSVSELLDELVTAARQSGRVGPPKSVVGTIDIDASDPLLDGADAAVGSLFEGSLRRPTVVRETRAEYESRPRRKARRG